MTRTFSKIYGLAGIRLGWCYAPLDVCDVINRIRGPFNTNGAAIAAGVAALEDHDHIEKAIAHNETWRAWLAQEIPRSGSRSRRASAISCFCISIDETQARAADRFLVEPGPDPARGRRLWACRTACGSPSAPRRRTVSSSRPSRISSTFREPRACLTVSGLRLSEPLFQRLALIGMGSDRLFPGARVPAQGARARDRRRGQYRRSVRANARRNSRSPIDVVETAAAAVEGADLVILCAPVGAMGTIAQDIAPNLVPGAILSDVGSVKASIIKAVAPHLPASVHFIPAHPVAGTEQSGPDGRICDAFSQPLEHI